MGVKPLVMVAGTALPEPSEYQSSTQTIVDSARNVAGVMVGAVIRDNVAKVSLKWRFLTTRQWAEINQLFIEEYGGQFINSVRFWNQDIAAYSIRKMYVSDRSAGVFRRHPKTGEVMGYLDCTMNLIEV